MITKSVMITAYLGGYLAYMSIAYLPELLLRITPQRLHRTAQELLLYYTYPRVITSS